ncbi:MAG: hypothetical protein LRY47_00055 [Seleniivibrio sp.]|nr:hypothetical protein [Seleniivibrio sp.]MCD8552300.1 hypothetical protein [Seleniivibrio sp.]
MTRLKNPFLGGRISPRTRTRLKFCLVMRFHAKYPKNSPRFAMMISG